MPTRGQPQPDDEPLFDADETGEAPDSNVVRLRPARRKVVVEHLTDTGNAKQMVARHGDVIRYCPTYRSWFLWDGAVWARDTTLAIERIAKATIREMHQDALAVADDDRRKAYVTHCLRSEATGRLRAMVDNAKSEVVVEPGDLDANPLLLCVENGTLDLKTGRLREHDPADLITLLAPVTFDPKATDDRWEEALDRFVRPDDGKEEFLQRAAFASFTGTATDKAFLNLFDDNDGNTGKTTFTESLRMALGPYATVVNADAFLLRPNGFAAGIRSDLASLAGKRMVVSSEIPSGRRLDVALMKKLTDGGGSFQFERKYENPWTGPITFTIWLDGNTVARAPAEDNPLFNRWRLTPFKHRIDGPADPKWIERARESAEYRAAVLAWVMKGRRAWLADGIGTAPVVEVAVADVKAEMDPLAPFWEERCVFGEGEWTSTQDLADAYSSWVADSGQHHEINDRDFASLLRGRGATKSGARRGGGERRRGWDGVGLRPRPHPSSGSVESGGAGDRGASGARRGGPRARWPE